VTIELLPGKAPGHVERIKELVRQGFYDGVVFHRVIDGFMAQGGDPTGTGMGGSEARTCAPSSTMSATSAASARWRVPMIRTPANSQFFICLDDASFLDRKYTVWGKVTSGMDAVDAPAEGRAAEKAGQDRLCQGRSGRLIFG
jgi:peptidylprolyl isomerase